MISIPAMVIFAELKLLKPLLNSPVILLHNIVEVFALPDLNLRSRLIIDGLDPGSIGTTLIDVNLFRLTVIPNGFLQKPFCSFDVTLGSKNKINGLAIFVYSPIEVLPLSLYTDVSSILQLAPVGRLYFLNLFSISGVYFRTQRLMLE
jgi:hypothetical protein